MEEEQLGAPARDEAATYARMPKISIGSKRWQPK